MAGGFRKIQWTAHSEIKMRQYGLSRQKILNLLRKPERIEKGIADGTSAAMKTNKVFGNPTKKLLNIVVPGQPQKPKKAPGEVWLMYRDTKTERKIISAWRYPGVTKPGESIPIPQDILNELTANNELQ
jgi:hypothetical protein